MAIRSIEGFIWIPIDYSNSDYAILIDGTDQQPNVIEAEFTKAIAPEMGTFKIKLDNNSGEYTDRYVAEKEVELRYNVAGTATTTRFKGIIEEIKKVTDDGSGEVLELTGVHLSGQLLDLNVAKTYDGTITADAVIRDLVATYFPTFTTNNVKASSALPKIAFNAVPFWDAASKIAEIAGFDLYVDDDKDFHFFERGSIINEDEAIGYEDNLFDIEGFGTDTAEVKNKVIAQGEDSEGLPVVYTSEDAASQTSYRIKEKIVINADIKNASQAQEAAASEVSAQPTELGKATTWLLATVNPGDSIMITNPEAGIKPQLVTIARFTHNPLTEQTVSEIAAVRSFAGLFRDRIKKEVQLEKVQNLFKLKYSFNLTFDSTSDGDAAASTPNVAFANGEIYLSSGSVGTFISKTHIAPVSASQVHFKAVGEALPDALFDVSSDNGNSWQNVSLETLTVLTSAGNLLRIRIRMNAAGVRIKSAALLYS